MTQKPVLRPRKKEILERAASLFLERGYKATSVRDIAAAVGIEASSLYSHIQSKESILELLCHACADRFLEALDEILEDTHPSDISRLVKVFEFHIDTAFEDPMAGTVFSDEWKNLPEDRKKLYLEKKKSYEAKLSQLLSQLMEAGVVRKTDPSTLMHTLISSVRWLYHSKKPFSVEEKATYKKDIIEVWVNGLNNQKPESMG